MTESTKYEMMVIIRPDLTQKQTEDELKKLRDFIQTQKGSIYHEDIWGMRKLAHRIKKHDNGYYAIFYFEIAPGEIKELTQNIKLEQNLVRFLILKTPEDYEVKNMGDFEFEEPSARPAAQKTDKPGKESATKRPAKKETAKKEVKKEDKAEKEEKKPAKKEEKEDKKDESKDETKEDKKEKGAKLEEIDEKLQSIIDDPDIMQI